ncbi:immunoglobulin superfamily containing leucine-rich repeat protein-like [Hyperolius riggenbachi]|uniref:immunoglobulin superfamily containing leucine-rich repeat protein-like n=1 Tax=Hyperolius riggenbachi TaxID=752182 RepID=UPI0035A2C226
MDFYFEFFGIVCYLFLVPSASCPVECRCTNATRPSVDCSYRDLIYVPTNLPDRLRQLTLSVNQISDLSATSFANTVEVKSLWLSYNKITTIQAGTFHSLTHLMNLDLSHNKLSNFPWGDLLTLGDLQLLNLNNNHLVAISPGTFNNSRSLRSLQLSSNHLYSLPEGIFDPLTALSHLQLHDNAFHCSCSLLWLMDWIKKVKTIDKKGDVICLTPNDLKGTSLEKVPDMYCRKPLEVMGDNPSLANTLLLCREVGVPYLLTHKLDNEDNSYKNIKVSTKIFANGSITLSPDKKGALYLCHVSNHTAGNTDKISMSIARYEISGWPNEPGQKLLLLLVSDKLSSEVDAGSCVSPIGRMHSLLLLGLLWYTIS